MRRQPSGDFLPYLVLLRPALACGHARVDVMRAPFASTCVYM